IAEERLELVPAEGSRLSVREVQGHRLGDEGMYLYLVERRTAGDLVRGQVDVGADVVEQLVLRHRVAVPLHLREVVEGRRRQPRIERHVVRVVVAEVDDPHGDEYAIPRGLSSITAAGKRRSGPSRASRGSRPPRRAGRAAGTRAPGLRRRDVQGSGRP